MRVEVKIDNSCIEPKIIVLTASMTEEVSKIIQKLSDNNPQIITGSKNEKIEVLEQDELIRIYAANSRVFAAANSGEITFPLSSLMDCVVNALLRISSCAISKLLF